DAFVYFRNGEDIRIVRYFVRSSLASIFAEPLIGVDLSGLESNYQRRIVERNLSNTFRSYFHAEEFDFFVYDPTDEQFSLLYFGGGVRGTYSHGAGKVLDKTVAQFIPSSTGAFIASGRR